jgi:hypothetical protein
MCEWNKFYEQQEIAWMMFYFYNFIALWDKKMKIRHENEENKLAMNWNNVNGYV